MALPTNRIKKIKLPDNTEYEIVPERLGKNNYEAKLPYFYYDSTFLIESNYITIPISDTGNDEYYFGEIIPDDIKGAWKAEFYFKCTAPSPVGNQDIIVPEGKITLMCATGFVSSTFVNSNANNVSFEAELSQRPKVTGSGSVYIQNFIFRSLRSDYAEEAWGNDYGNLFGFQFNPVNGNISNIKIKLLKLEGCTVHLFEDGAIKGYTNTPVYQDNPNYICQYNQTFRVDRIGLVSSNIDSAANTASVSNYYNGTNFYLTGATGIGQNNLYRDYNKYFKNGNLYLYGGTTYVDNIGCNGTYYYGDGISYYDEDEDDSFYLNFPAKAGTIALTSDITNVPIEDLTNVQPTPTEPESLFCYDVSDTMPGEMTIRFSKGFIPTSITATESYYNPPSVVSVTLHLNESTNKIVIDSASNCNVDSYCFLSEDDDSYDYCFIYLNNISVPYSGNPPQVKVEGTFMYKSGNWLYEL